jgi:FAD/FMN-containing dehydrogenase
MDIYNIPLADYSMKSALPLVTGFAWTSQGRRKMTIKHINRRDVLRVLAGFATAAAGVAASMAATTADASVAQTEKQPPPLDGELSFDKQSRAAAADDFGHIVHRKPKGVLLPGSAQDVATTICWAAGQGHKIAPQGQSHSVYGRAQVNDGIVIDMSRLHTVHDVQGDRVVVDAGAKWSEVLAATLPHGLTPPVLAEYLELSVGGALVVGGVGATSSRYGVQSDNVLALDVVTGKGQQVTCSPDTNADLFDAVRAGLGQVAVITQATLKLIPAPEQVRRYVLTYPNLNSMLTDERLLAADHRLDAVQGAVLPTPTGWRYRLDAVSQFSGNYPPDDEALLAGLSDDRSAAEINTLPYFDYLNRLAALEQALRANGQWFHPHPWLTTFVGDSKVESVVSEELANLTSGDLGTFGQVVLSAFHREAITSPLLRLPEDDLVYAFNLVRIPTTDDAAESNRLVKANRAIYKRVRAAGGTLYPVSAFPMSHDDWRRHFGSAWERLHEAKRTFDPGRVLTPGYEVF